MQTTIYNLREQVLPPSLQAKLFPFVNAYRPHDDPPTRTQLMGEGLDRIEDESLMDLIEEQHAVLSTS